MSDASIEKRLEFLEKAEAEYKTQKEMLNDALQNDDELLTLEEKMKDARKRFQAQKEAVLNEPENRKLQEKMQDMAVEIKDTKKLLADELIAWFMKNNSTDYTDGKGNKRRIAVSARFIGSRNEE
jgi:hypothetical protein